MCFIKFSFSTPSFGWMSSLSNQLVFFLSTNWKIMAFAQKVVVNLQNTLFSKQGGKNTTNTYNRDKNIITTETTMTTTAVASRNTINTEPFFVVLRSWICKKRFECKRIERFENEKLPVFFLQQLLSSNQTLRWFSRLFIHLFTEKLCRTTSHLEAERWLSFDKCFINVYG